MERPAEAWQSHLRDLCSLSPFSFWSIWLDSGKSKKLVDLKYIKMKLMHVRHILKIVLGLLPFCDAFLGLELASQTAASVLFSCPHGHPWCWLMLVFEKKRHQWWFDSSLTDALPLLCPTWLWGSDEMVRKHRIIRSTAVWFLFLLQETSCCWWWDWRVMMTVCPGLPALQDSVCPDFFPLGPRIFNCSYFCLIVLLLYCVLFPFRDAEKWVHTVCLGWYVCSRMVPLWLLRDCHDFCF